MYFYMANVNLDLSMYLLLSFSFFVSVFPCGIIFLLLEKHRLEISSVWVPGEELFQLLFSETVFIFL